MQDPSQAEVIAATEAQLFVADIKTSCGFFAQKLGFSVAFTHGEPPFYAQVQRDRGVLNLRHVDAPVIDPALRAREGLLSATLALGTQAAAERLFWEFQAAGVSFFQQLKTEPWGAKTFIVADPDGNLILFAAPAA